MSLSAINIEELAQRAVATRTNLHILRNELSSIDNKMELGDLIKQIYALSLQSDMTGSALESIIKVLNIDSAKSMNDSDLSRVTDDDISFIKGTISFIFGGYIKGQGDPFNTNNPARSITVPKTAPTFIVWPMRDAAVAISTPPLHFNCYDGVLQVTLDRFNTQTWLNSTGVSTVGLNTNYGGSIYCKTGDFLLSFGYTHSAYYNAPFLSVPGVSGDLSAWGLPIFDGCFENSSDRAYCLFNGGSVSNQFVIEFQVTGTSWIPRVLPTIDGTADNYIQSMAYSASLNLFAGVSSTAVGGATYTNVADVFYKVATYSSMQGTKIRWIYDRFVICLGYSIRYSTDGVNWTVHLFDDTTLVVNDARQFLCYDGDEQECTNPWCMLLCNNGKIIFTKDYVNYYETCPLYNNTNWVEANTIGDNTMMISDGYEVMYIKTN